MKVIVRKPVKFIGLRYDADDTYYAGVRVPRSSMNEDAPVFSFST